MAEKLETAVRRAQIVAAAIEILSSEGARGLSISALAARVGLVPSAIYRHFRGKDEVLDGVVDSIHDQLMANVAEVRAATDDALDRLEMLLDRHAALIRANRGLSRLIFSGEIFGGRSARGKRMLSVIAGYRAQIDGIAREGQIAGRIRDDIDPSTVGVLYMGLIQPAAFLWHLSEGEFDANVEVERAWSLIRSALQPKGGRE